MRQQSAVFVFLMLFLAACDTLSGAANNATATPPAIAKVLATVFISPTPNPEQAAATRQASSPTPLPPTLTIIPSETPYIGIYVGDAPRDEGFAVITEPLFGDDVPVDPTANPEVCSIPIDSPYVTAWGTNSIVNRRLGCPIQVGFGFFGEAQLFDTGVMYHRPETGEIWAVLADPGRSEFFYLENPGEASTTGIEVPLGQQLPRGIFASMWLGVQNLRNRMGFPQTEVQEVAMGLQRFENGTFLLDATSEQLYALIVDGTVYGPFLAPSGVQPGIEQPSPTAATAQAADEFAIPTITPAP